MAVFWFIAAMTLMGAYYSGMKINALDITPNYAGTTTAMVNGIAAISGIISPYLIGLLTPNVSHVVHILMSTDAKSKSRCSVLRRLIALRWKICNRSIF